MNLMKFKISFVFQIYKILNIEFLIEVKIYFKIIFDLILYYNLSCIKICSHMYN